MELQKDLPLRTKVLTAMLAPVAAVGSAALLILAGALAATPAHAAEPAANSFKDNVTPVFTAPKGSAFGSCAEAKRVFNAATWEGSGTITLSIKGKPCEVTLKSAAPKK